MKKIIAYCLAFVIMFSGNVFAYNAKCSTEKLSENNIKITVNSDSNIKITGYTISKGSNIIVYYLKEDKGTKSDSIIINLNTVLRPYKIILSNSEQSLSYQPFKDIADNPMNEYIRHLYNLGYINGYEDDNTFRPDNYITRAEFISLVVRTLNLQKTAGQEIHFEDIDSNNWAYDNIIIAVQNGIVEGYIENSRRYAKPEQNITIAEVCKVLDEAFKVKNNNIANYDVRFVNHWAKANIQSLLNERIISEGDDFYKKGNIDKFAKRGEIVMLLSRTLGR